MDRPYIDASKTKHPNGKDQLFCREHLLSGWLRRKLLKSVYIKQGRVPVMTSNDFSDPLQRRRSSLERLADLMKPQERIRHELLRALADHKAIEPEIERKKIVSLETTAANLSRKIADQQVNKSNLEIRLQVANAAIAKPRAFWRYYSAEQKQLRLEVLRLASGLSATTELLSKDQKALSKIRADINAARRRISEHEKFDHDDCRKRLSSLSPKIDRLKASYDSEKAELMRLEAEIRPHTQEYARMKSELASLNSDIALASRFEQELSSASNSYQRAIIHKECEERLGTGSPRQVINDRRGRIRILEGNMPKVERRIKTQLQKLERTIGRLLIDGNNVCYEGQSFIGLQAISALVQDLDGRYKTTIVFDASIRAMLKTDTQGIERMLGEWSNICVAPTRTAADEYLMKLADQDENTFILSNDRFAEYHDYDVVKSGRVFKFLIAEGKLMINDIDISLDFSSLRMGNASNS